MISAPAISSRTPNSVPAALSRTNRRRTYSPTVALAIANARYWPTVAPRVRAQLARWEAAARAIDDPAMRAIALGKLREEGMNAKTAATLGTLVPRGQRATVTEAIVALQVLYDYLDALDERAAAQEAGAAAGETAKNWPPVLDALTDAVPLPGAAGPGRGQGDPGIDRDPVQLGSAHDGENYAARLAGAVAGSLAGLPRTDEVLEVARRAAGRCARAQALIHRANALGTEPLREWAGALEPGGPLRWQELLAGASASVLSLHALIAAAADERTTGERAQAIDDAYMAIGALTMLDSVIDHDDDVAGGQRGFVHHYDGDRELLARRGAAVAREARVRACALPDGAHHAMTLAGIVAYYACAPGADPEIVAPIRRELEPEITPTMGLMRVWRAADAKRRGPERPAPAAKAPAKTA